MSLFKSVLSITLLAVVAGATGCAFSKDADKEAAVGKAQVLTGEDTLRAEELKSEIQETENLNEYFVRFYWPRGKKLRVEVKHGDMIYTSQAGDRELVLPIDKGRTEKYFVSVYNSLGGVILNRVETLTAPIDLLVDGVETLDKDTVWEYNRIHLTKNARITLNGHDLFIQANHIQSDRDAELRSLDAPTFAKSKEDLTGSQITINAQKANGALTVYLIGFMGRDGKSGDELDRENNFIDQFTKLNGRPGVDGKSTERCGGAGVYKECNWYCEQEPSNGEAGKPGSAGQNGEDGWDGGNPGRLAVFVEDPKSRLNIEVIAKAGAEGKGGAGGQGRQGGKGGRAGKSAEGCKSARAGQDGPRGPSGKRGQDGKQAASVEVQTTPGATNVSFRIR